MNLLRRIERLELAQEKGTAAVTRMAIEAMERRFKEMTDDELNALIAEADDLPSDPDLEARLAHMSNEELCRIILEGERA